MLAPGPPLLSLQRTLSTASDRSTLSLSLTDADVSMEESFDFNDQGDNVFLRGGNRNLAIGASSLAMRDHPKMFKVAYEDLEIGSVIGKGSTGAVLEAVHKPTGTRLALKVINMFDKSRRSQLIREICTLYDAACPSLITFYGAFYREGCITLALEMMDGGALANLVAQLGPIPEVALANMVFQILWALAYLKHDKRVHRDIKPSNILINSQGEVKVSDFGVSAELQSTLAMCGTFVGTFKYMSPERIRNQPYDYASDIWSLGLTLIECATGRYPYMGPPAGGVDEAAPKPAKGKKGRSHGCIDMIQAITENDPPTLPEGPHFSDEFREFLKNLLHKDPRRRLPPEILLGAPWLRQSGAVTLAAAVRNTRHWIHHEAVPGRQHAGNPTPPLPSSSAALSHPPPPPPPPVVSHSGSSGGSSSSSSSSNPPPPHPIVSPVPLTAAPSLTLPSRPPTGSGGRWNSTGGGGPSTGGRGRGGGSRPQNMVPLRSFSA